MLVDRKLRYTMTDHAYLMLNWLESGKISCRECPARPVQDFFATPKVWRYYENKPPQEKPPHWFNYFIEQGNNICEVCTGFVGIIEDVPCPCHHFGSLEEAVKQTWLWLEAREYI